MAGGSSGYRTPWEAPAYDGTDFIIVPEDRIAAFYLFLTSYRDLDSDVRPS